MVAKVAVYLQLLYLLSAGAMPYASVTNNCLLSQPALRSALPGCENFTLSYFQLFRFLRCAIPSWSR